MTELSITPANMKEVAFDGQFQSFVELTEKRASLEAETKLTSSALKTFVQAHATDEAHGMMAYDIEKFIKAYEEPVKVEPELARFSDYSGGLGYLENLLQSSGSKLVQDRIGATAFKALQGLVEDARTASDKTRKVDKAATKDLQKEYRELVNQWRKAESELDEVKSRIAGIKEQVDMADKIANIGSKLKKR